MSADGSDVGSSEEPMPPFFTRLATTTRGGVTAVGTAAAGAFMVAKDGLESLRDGAHKTAIRMDKWAAAGVVGRTFRFKERSAKLTSELRAGLITFLMVSYILAVNPAILQTTGGTCDPTVVCTAEDYELLGPQCLTNTDDDRAQECMMQLTRSLITATAVSSLISTFFIGYFGNLPLALAPGIGITAYVSYQVVGQYGTGQISYQQAMTAVFIEGFIFIILSVTGVRGGIIKYMPKSIAMASSVGIGMLLAFTGLRNLGLIVFDSATLLTLGGCPPSTRNYLYAFDQQVTAQSLSNLTFSAFPAPASVYGCVTDSMRSPTMWLGVAGGFLMCILLYMGIKGSLILGILFVTIISWIPGHGASYLGASSPIPGGEQRLELFKELVAVPTLSATGLAWDWSAFSDGKLWLALFTFLYIDLLDCTGTLLSMARLLDFNMPGFLSESMEFPGQMWAFLSDGIGIISGSMMGTTSLTVYIESAAGIEDGGRTGLTAVVVSFFFLASLFFSPIIASIPPYATGPALVLVGTILLGHIAHIEWDDIGVAIPAFLTMVLMPFTYSVAYGVIAGLVSYVAIHAPFWAADFIRKRWRPGSGGPNSPRLTRAQRRDRRSKTGYHMRKTFGPQGDPPSRADSFVGGPWYDDSYHTQDSRRSALPISMLPSGGGGMGMAAGSMPNSIYPPGHSIAPSIVNMFFPDNSVRGGGTVGSMRGAITGGYGRSGSAGDTDLPSASNGLQNMYRKSYSLHSPRRATDPSARSPTPDLGSRTQNRSLTDVHSVSPTASSPMPGYISRASPHSFRPALIRQMSARGASLGGSPRKGLGPAHNKLKMQRSCSFSHGINDLGQGSDLHLKQQSTSDHGGNLFKLFPDAPNLEGAHSAGFAGMASASFKLFGDVEPLALGLSGEVELADGDAQAEQPFRLFGDIEPLELHKGKQREGVGGNSRAAPTFRVSSHLNDNDRTGGGLSGTADLTFGGTSPLEEPLPAGQRAAPPAEDWLKGTLRGSSAYSEMILEAMQAQASQEMSPAAGQAGLRVPSSFQAAVAGEAAAAAMAAAAAGGSAASLQQCGSSIEEAQRAAAAAPAGTSNSQMAGEGGGTGGSEEDEVVYRKLMSSKSLQGGSAPRSDASADGGRTTYSSTSASSSVHGGTPAHGFLKPSSLVAAAAQLASVYKQDGQRHPSSEGSGRSLGANPVGASPEDHPSFLGAAASAPTSEPTAEPLLQQRASPFEGQRVASAPEGGLLDGASTERDYWNPRGPASSKASHWMSGAAPDEEHLE